MEGFEDFDDAMEASLESNFGDLDGSDDDAQSSSDGNDSDCD